MSVILVTGASGLIGSHILLELLQQGHALRALTRNSNKAIVFFSRLLKHYQLDEKLSAGIIWIEGDLRDVARYDEYLHSIETVFHCAGLVSTASSDRKKMYEVNVRCTADLVNHCLNTSVKWFGHMSSVASLGPNPEGLVDEDYFWKQDKNHSNYALSKYLSEQEVWRAKEEGLAVQVFNPAVVVGPSAENGNLHKLYNRLMRGMPFYLKGSSGFIDVRDLATFCVLQWTKKVSGTRVIISAENLSQHDFLQIVCTALNVSPPRYALNKTVFKIASATEFIIRFGQSKKCLLQNDLYKMGSSKNRYDNQKSLQMGAQYQSIKEAIENSVRFSKVTLNAFH
jgi:nucleoside-diphosphate-sugar epimerase